MQQPTALDSTRADADDEAATTSPLPASTTSPALALLLPSSLPQTSALLRLPGELRNRIYSHILNTPSENDLLFSEAHALASTSRELRSEFWPYFLSRAIFRVDLRHYNDFFGTFYPPASPAIMQTYVGNFTFTVPTRGAMFIAEVTQDAQGETLDLLPLVLLLRASPHIHFTLDAESTWLCRRRDLKTFLMYVRSNPTWVVAPLLDSLALRMREAQMVPGVWDNLWIVDVRLRRDLQFVYETMGLLAWVGQREGRGREGVTVCVGWDREGAVRKVSWVGSVKSGVGQVWKRVRGWRSPWGEKIWFGL